MGVEVNVRVFGVFLGSMYFLGVLVKTAQS
jgi:hypothetical protein